jgi:urea transport system permease protein
LPIAADALQAAEDAMVNNRLRGEIDNALSALQLLSPDTAVRRAAVKALQGQVSEAQLPLIDNAIAKESDGNIRDSLNLLRAAALLGSEDPAKRLAAAELLVEIGQDLADRGIRLALCCANPQVEAALKKLDLDARRPPLTIHANIAGARGMLLGDRASTD